MAEVEKVIVDLCGLRRFMAKLKALGELQESINLIVVKNSI